MSETILDTLTILDRGNSDHDRDLIIGTMRRWIDGGEPVWSYQDILERWGREFLMYRLAWESGERESVSSMQRGIQLHTMRDDAVREFGYAIPCRELLDVVERHQPIVDVGAGSGYMTAIMRSRGIDVIGTDMNEKGKIFRIGKYDNRQERLPGKTAARRYRDRTVFCSWPTLDHTWFRQTLRAMRIGQRLVVIEEDACAEDSTWEYRDQAFKMEERIKLPAWPMLNDRAGLWIKKRNPAMRLRTLKQLEEERREGWERLKAWSAELEEKGTITLQALSPSDRLRIKGSKIEVVTQEDAT